MMCRKRGTSSLDSSRLLEMVLRCTRGVSSPCIIVSKLITLAGLLIVSCTGQPVGQAMHIAYAALRVGRDGSDVQPPSCRAPSRVYLGRPRKNISAAASNKLCF